MGMATTLDDVLVAESGAGTQVGNIQNKVEALDTRVGNLEISVGSLETRIGNLEDQTTTNCGKLTTLQESVDRIENRLEGKKVTLKKKD